MGARTTGGTDQKSSCTSISGVRRNRSGVPRKLQRNLGRKGAEYPPARKKTKGLGKRGYGSWRKQNLVNESRRKRVSLNVEEASNIAEIQKIEEKDTMSPGC